MKVSVVSMPTIFADITANMEQAEIYISYAKNRGAKIIVFPEFFTTGFALNKQLIAAIKHSSYIKDQLNDWAKTYNIVIAGSYLDPDQDTKEVYNTFGLFFPTGEMYFHKKDIPTALESFCYTYGDEISAFDTPLGRIGVVMCWEQLRWQSIKRMAGKIDFLIGGSCWWAITPEDGPQSYSLLHDYNKQLALNAPIQLAKLLGVPMLHASHFASFPGLSMTMQSDCTREIESPTMIIDANGQLLAQNQGQAGCFFSNIQPGCIKNTPEIPKNKYWIPPMPQPLEQGFHMLNKQFRKIYEENVRPAVF